MTKQEPSVASTVGKGFAHVQHLTDKVIGWGLKKMKETGESEPIGDNTKAAGKAEKAVRGTLKFFGTLGDAYYTKYEELKKDDAQKEVHY